LMRKEKYLSFPKEDIKELEANKEISVKDVKIKDYKVMKEVFRFKFLYEIYSMLKQKSILKNKYSYLLIMDVLRGNISLLKFLINAMMEQEKMKLVTGSRES